MTNKDGISVEGDYPRIWLSPLYDDGLEPDEGRQWCQDKVWNNGTEYVRADLLSEREAAKDAEIARIKGVLGYIVKGWPSSAAALVATDALTKGQVDEG